MNTNFLSSYLEYVAGGECPTIYHRWSALAGVGAYLERNTFIQHGRNRIYSNMYVMLIGTAGARKSTAIKAFKRVMIAAGYNTIAAAKSSKEQFLMDLMGEELDDDTPEAILDRNIFGLGQDRDVSPMAILADEFADFMGQGNIEYINLLTNLWDYEGVYESRIKNGKSAKVNNPTISILGGITPTSFASAMPPEVIGQGFLSRFILVHSDPSGIKIAFPDQGDGDVLGIAKELVDIKLATVGEAKITSGAKKVLEAIYLSDEPLEDNRLSHYSTRRFTHLLKLCIVCAACRYSLEIQEGDVILANTILTKTESDMPKALGEFGKSRFSDVANKVMQILGESSKPLTLQQLYKMLSTDIDKQHDLAQVISNLMTAEKVIAQGLGFVIKAKALRAESKYVDYKLIT